MAACASQDNNNIVIMTIWVQRVGTYNIILEVCAVVKIQKKICYNIVLQLLYIIILL